MTHCLTREFVRSNSCAAIRGSPSRDLIASRGIGIKDSGAAGVDGFQAELELVRRREALFGAGENDQSLAVGKAEQLVDGIQVALR